MHTSILSICLLGLTCGHAEFVVEQAATSDDNGGLELLQMRGQIETDEAEEDEAEEDEHQKRTDEMDKQAEQLRKLIQEGGKMGSGRTSKELDAMVKTIMDQMKAKVLPGIVQAHDASVESLTAVINEITSCESYLNNGYKKANLDAAAAGTAHDSCREAQGPLNSTCQADKAELDAEITMLVPTPSTVAITGANSGSMSHYDNIQTEVTEAKTWGAEKVKVYVPKLDKYKAAKAALETKQQECNKAQRDFEVAWCGWRADLVSACSTYSTCRTAKVSLFDKTKATVAATVKSSKAEFRGAKQILCYVKLLNTSTAQEEVGKCDKETYDTSHLDIVPPTVPEAKKCDTSPVGTFPCQAAWVKTEFTSKAWHTLAPSAACNAPCPDISGLTPKEAAFSGGEE